MMQFEGLRQPDDLMRFWQNYLHPSINKSTWSQDEIAKLVEVSEKYKWSHWDQIAESLGVSVAKEVVLVHVVSSVFRIRKLGLDCVKMQSEEHVDTHLGGGILFTVYPDLSSHSFFLDWEDSFHVFPDISALHL